MRATTSMDSERENQRGHSRCDPSNGDSCDDADNSPPPLGAEIASSDEEFESHPEVPRSVRDFGTRLRRRASAASSDLIWTSAVGLLAFNEEIIAIQAVISTQFSVPSLALIR